MSVVVARDENTAGHLVFPWPSPLPWGAELVCAEHEVAIICPNWEVGERLGPGRHTISPPNPQSHILAYFFNVAPQKVPFERYIAVMDRASGQPVTVRFFGTIQIKIGNPVLMCHQVVGLPYHDFSTGILRSVGISISKSFSRLIAKLAAASPSVKDIASQGTAAQLVSLVSTTNPMAVAVAGIEMIKVEQFGLAIANVPPVLWPPPGMEPSGTTNLDADLDAPTTLDNMVLPVVDAATEKVTVPKEVTGSEPPIRPGTNPFAPLPGSDGTVEALENSPTPPEGNAAAGAPPPGGPPPAVPPPMPSASNPPSGRTPPVVSGRTTLAPGGAPPPPMPPPQRNPTMPPGAAPPPAHPAPAMQPGRNPTMPPGAPMPAPQPVRNPTMPPGGHMHPPGRNPTMPPGMQPPSGVHPPQGMHPPPGPQYGGRVMPQQPGRVQPTMPGRTNSMPPGAHMAPGRVQPTAPGRVMPQQPGRVQPTGPGRMPPARPSSPMMPHRAPSGGGGGRRKTPPLGMQSQPGIQPPMAPGQQLQLGSQVLVYWNDGLWHAGTVRQFANGRYQVSIDGINAMTWVLFNQLRLP